MKENVATKEVTMYQATIKFEGKWVVTPEVATIDEALAYIKRARAKSTSRNMPCNIITCTRTVLAE